MSDPESRPDPQQPDVPVAEDLVSALEVIEEQPLAQRPDGYAALYDELARRLDGTGSA